MQMSRLQMAALDEYIESPEFKELGKFHQPKSKQERDEEARRLSEEKQKLKEEAECAMMSMGKGGDRRTTVILPSSFAAVIPKTGMMELRKHQSVGLNNKFGPGKTGSLKNMSNM